MTDKCKCGRPLWSITERELKICNSCADESYEREQARREFEYYYPSDEAGEHQEVIDAIEAHNTGEE